MTNAASTLSSCSRLNNRRIFPSKLLSILPAKLRRVAALLPWLIYLLGADTVLSLLLAAKPIFPKQTYNVSSVIARSVWIWIQRIFTRDNNAHIAVSSSASGLPSDESAVVIANHVSWTDFYMIQEVAELKGMLGRCRWLAKKSLRWVPFLGWGIWAMGMPLVSRNWATDQSELAKVFRGIVTRQLPVWLITYSEGTRFTQSKHAEAVLWCAKRSRFPSSPPQHTLWPRPRGFTATVSSLRKTSHVTAVYDFTIAYAQVPSPLNTLTSPRFMHAPSFVDSVLCPDLQAAGYRFAVHVDRFALAELPEDDEGLGKWLEERWVAKGQRLEKLRCRLVNDELWGFE